MPVVTSALVNLRNDPNPNLNGLLHVPVAAAPPPSHLPLQMSGSLHLPEPRTTDPYPPLLSRYHQLTI